jgi:hypothetical protein
LGRRRVDPGHRQLRGETAIALEPGDRQPPGSPSKVYETPDILCCKSGAVCPGGYAGQIDSYARTAIWAGAVSFVAAGWVAGYLQLPDHEGDFGSFSDLTEARLSLEIGFPLAVAAGVLLSRPGIPRVIGYVLLASACLVLAFLAWFSFFGGICLDPGEDVCVTTWPSRITALGAALACLIAGFGSQLLASRLLKRR